MRSNQPSPMLRPSRPSHLRSPNPMRPCRPHRAYSKRDAGMAVLGTVVLEEQLKTLTRTWPSVDGLDTQQRGRLVSACAAAGPRASGRVAARPCDCAAVCRAACANTVASAVGLMGLPAACLVSALRTVAVCGGAQDGLIGPASSGPTMARRGGRGSEGGRAEESAGRKNATPAPATPARLPVSACRPRTT